MKVEFKGIIAACDTIQVNTEKTKGYIQKILIRQPERKNDFDEVIQKETFFEVSNFQKDLNEFTDWEKKIGAKVICEAWLNSNYYKNEAGKESYILNLNLKSLKEF